MRPNLFMFDSLWPHRLQLTRPPCPSPTPRVYWNSCPLSRWCYPTISSSDIPLSSCLQSFSASGSFPMSQFFTSGVWSIAVSVSVLPVNIQSWFPLALSGLFSLQSKGLSSFFFCTTVQKHQFFGTQPSFGSTLTSIHDYWKYHSFDCIVLFFNLNLPLSMWDLSPLTGDQTLTPCIKKSTES